MLLLPMVVNADQLTEGMPTFNYCVAMPEIQKTDGMLDSDGANTWWGYVKDNTKRHGLGTGAIGTMNQCILLSKSNSAVVGKTLKAVRFYLRSTTDIKDLKVWLSSTLPTTADKANILVQDVDLSTMQGGDESDDFNGLPNVVELSTPYTMTSSRNVYVGYSFTVTSVNAQSGQYPIVLCDEEGVTGSSYLKYGSQWEAGQSYGPLDLKVLLEGEFSQNAVTPSSPGEVIAALGNEATVSIPFTNVGSAAITSIDYTISDAQGTGTEQHYDLPEAFPYYGASVTFQIPVQAGSEVGSVEKTLTITKVNGQPNEAAENSVSFTLTTLSKLVPRGIVIEEFTGTGDGWCPRGLVGMEKMRKEFGDTFVGIGIHNYNSTDPMYISAYNQVSFSGAPSCRLNRGPEIDPYYGSGNDVFDDFRAAMAIPAKVGVTVSGEWNADSTKITAKAEIEALVDGEYAIEYVLIADGLTGTTNAWKQSNYYTQYTPDQLPEDMQILTTLGSSYFTVFNDVAIAVAKQTQTTAPGDLTAGQVVENTYTLSMPTKSELLQAVKNGKVAVVALLINKDNNMIENAAKFYLPKFEPSDITQLDDAIYANSLTASPGFTTRVDVMMKNTTLPSNGCAFLLTLPQGFEFVKDSNGKVVYELGERASNMTLTQEERSQNSCHFTLSPSQTNAAINETDGIIASFMIKVPDQIAYGDYGVQLVDVQNYITENGKLRVIDWDNFNYLISIIPLKCATPTIAFDNGKLTFECETEGVEFKYNISMKGDQSDSGNEVLLPILTPTYTVSVYTTKEGYVNSDVATQVITYQPKTGDVNNDGDITIADAVAVVDLILNAVPEPKFYYSVGTEEVTADNYTTANGAQYKSSLAEIPETLDLSAISQQQAVILLPEGCMPMIRSASGLVGTTSVSLGNGYMVYTTTSAINGSECTCAVYK